MLGGWSIIPSFVLGYSELEIARNSDIAAGLVVAAVSLFDWIYTSAGARRRSVNGRGEKKGAGHRGPLLGCVCRTHSGESQNNNVRL